MELGFWGGLAVGLLVALIGSIAANLVHPKILGFLDSRKTSSQEKRRKEAFRLDKVILDLHSGKRDKHFYLMKSATAVGVAITVAFSNLIAAVVVIALSPPPRFTLNLSSIYLSIVDVSSINPENLWRVVWVIFLIFFSFFSLVWQGHSPPNTKMLPARLRTSLNTIRTFKRAGEIGHRLPRLEVFCRVNALKSKKSRTDRIT